MSSFLFRLGEMMNKEIFTCCACFVVMSCTGGEFTVPDQGEDLPEVVDFIDSDTPPEADVPVEPDADSTESVDQPVEDGPADEPETDPCSPLPSGCDCEEACVDGLCDNDRCPPDPCEHIDGVSYGTISILSEPTDIPAAEHPDINVKVRGWAPADSGEPAELIDYSGDTDELAPKLYSLFTDDEFPGFGDLFVVGCWDGIDECTAGGWPVHLAGLFTAAGDVIETPRSGYDIGEGYTVMVLYADEDSMTLKYNRDDHVVYGYTIHIVGICVEPDLLALYEESNASGRGNLPALRGDQPLGRSRGEQVLVSIRDTGAFMDPRSRKDWW